MKLKKIITIKLFLLLFINGFSQTKKGTFILSGNTNLNFLFSNTTIGTDSISTNKAKSNQFGFNSGVGFFLANNFAVAVSAAYLYTDDKFMPVGQSATESVTTTLAIVPQLVYYLPFQGKLKPVISIGIGSVSQKQRASTVTANNNTAYSFTGSSFNATAGLSYFITKSLSFDLGMQYSNTRLNNNLSTRVYQKDSAVAGTIGITIFFFKVNHASKLAIEKNNNN